MVCVYCIACFLFRCLFRLLYGLEVRGAEHLDFEGGALIASSHASYYDPPLIGCSTPQHAHFLARESLFSTPVLGFLIRRLHAHPLKGESTLKSIRMVIDLIKGGDKVVIFPEGHRSRTGELQAVQPGTALIVGKAECPIIPCYIEGAYEAWPRHKRFPRLRGKIRVTFGPPIPWERFAELPKKERQPAICAAVGEELERLSKT